MAPPNIFHYFSIDIIFLGKIILYNFVKNHKGFKFFIEKLNLYFLF